MFAAVTCLNCKQVKVFDPRHSKILTSLISKHLPRCGPFCTSTQNMKNHLDCNLSFFHPNRFFISVEANN